MLICEWKMETWGQFWKDKVNEMTKNAVKFQFKSICLIAFDKVSLKLPLKYMKIELFFL